MNELSNIPLIISVEKMTLGEAERQNLAAKGEMWLSGAEELQESIDVFRIGYRSNGHTVVGYVAEPKVKSKQPCVIVNRGGSKEFGKWEAHSIFSGFPARLASWGYISIFSQYSGNGGSEGKDELGGSDIQDVYALYDILKSYSYADTERLGMYGASRGGMMTYLMLMNVTWIKAAAVKAGMSNLFRNYELRPELKAYHADMYDVTSDEEIKKRSPLLWVEKFCKSTPLLLLHGSGDNRVSPLDSLELSIELYKHKIPYRLMMLEGGDHYLTEFRKLHSQAVKRWFERYLLENEELPNLEPHGI
jgi:dipeptidyl aminopeptidase/acylaminoacyl peptidase